MIRSAAELIDSGCKDEKHTLAASLLPVCEKILLEFLEKDRSQLGTSNNLIIEVVNSPKEAIISAILNYSLKIRRLNKQTNLSENIKKAIEPFISMPQDMAFFVALGYHLTVIYFIDKDWVTQNINRIFVRKNTDLFKGAMIGYLAGSSAVYQEIYQLMKLNEIYQEAIKCNFEDKHANEMLTGHIIVSYLNDFEKLEEKNSLILMMIEKCDAIQFLAIARFFSPAGSQLPESQRTKIIPLWKELVDAILKKDDVSDFQEVLVSLINWINLLDKMSEQAAEILSKIVKFIKFDYQANFLFDGLVKFVNSDPKLVGNIFLKLTSSGLFVSYRNDVVTRLVKDLYERGERNTANQICNLYRENGLFYLEDICCF